MIAHVMVTAFMFFVGYALARTTIEKRKIMTSRSEAKDEIRRIQSEIDISERLWLVPERFGKNDFGFELLVSTRTFGIGDTAEWTPVFVTKDPQLMRDLLKILSKSL